MIRVAKGVALHDLSFWSSTLPLLDGFQRITKHYQYRFSYGMSMRLDARTGLTLHEETLEAFQRIHSRQPMNGAPPLSYRAQKLGSSLHGYLSELPHDGAPAVNEAIVGCGIVNSGSCDLLWPPAVVELKLTAKEPGTPDVRQVLVYAALLYLDRSMRLERGIVANPRLGVALQFGLDELLAMTGGMDIDDFSERLADFLVTAARSG